MKYISSISKNVISNIVILLCCMTAHSQGTWDIKYIPVGYLHHSLIGKEVRIDFKTFDQDTVNGEIGSLAIRKLLLTKDTVGLYINKRLMLFREHWRFYVDHGALADQYLENLTGKEEKSVFIKELFLEEIHDDSLVLQAVLYEHGSESGVKQKVEVKKSTIKGLLLRNAG